MTFNARSVDTVAIASGLNNAQQPWNMYRHPCRAYGPCIYKFGWCDVAAYEERHARGIWRHARLRKFKIFMLSEVASGGLCDTMLQLFSTVVYYAHVQKCSIVPCSVHGSCIHWHKITIFLLLYNGKILCHSFLAV